MQLPLDCHQNGLLTSPKLPLLGYSLLNEHYFRFVCSNRIVLLPKLAKIIDNFCRVYLCVGSKLVQEVRYKM